MGIMHDLGNWSYGRGSCAYVDMVNALYDLHNLTL